MSLMLLVFFKCWCLSTSACRVHADLSPEGGSGGVGWVGHGVSPQLASGTRLPELGALPVTWGSALLLRSMCQSLPLGWAGLLCARWVVGVPLPQMLLLPHPSALLHPRTSESCSTLHTLLHRGFPFPPSVWFTCLMPFGDSS